MAFFFLGKSVPPQPKPPPFFGDWLKPPSLCKQRHQIFGLLVSLGSAIFMSPCPPLYRHKHREDSASPHFIFYASYPVFLPLLLPAFKVRSFFSQETFAALPFFLAQMHNVRPCPPPFFPSCSRFPSGNPDHANLREGDCPSLVFFVWPSSLAGSLCLQSKGTPIGPPPSFPTVLPPPIGRLTR